jgi:peptidoglycan/LPS O-acetylase OafA/YrhL
MTVRGERDKAGYRPDIEGLRGVAVLLVVAYHAGILGFTGGFIGVDVFFALSGYLITGLIVKEIQRTKRLDFARFYARRVRRLLPAFGLVLTVVLLVGMAAFSPIEQELFTRTARRTAVYLGNVWFMLQTNDYFAPESAANPLLHTWSLAVEEQFYVFWPAIIALAFWRARSRKTLIAVLASSSAVSFMICVWLTRTREPWAFYSSPARAWEFGLGGLASLVPEVSLFAYRLSRRVLGWGGLALILGAAFCYSSETAFPGIAALLPVVGTVGILISCAQAGGGGRLESFLSSRPLQLLGILSYSWYLWHWPVLIMASARFPSIATLGKLVSVLIALALAALTYYLVENPIRFNSHLVRAPLLSLGLAAVVPAICLGVSHLERNSALRALSSPEQKRYLSASRDRDLLVSSGCIADFGESRPRECVFGNEDSPTTIVLFGDSHANPKSPGL